MNLFSHSFSSTQHRLVDLDTNIKYTTNEYHTMNKILFLLFLLLIHVDSQQPDSQPKQRRKKSSATTQSNVSPSSNPPSQTKPIPTKPPAKTKPTPPKLPSKPNLIVIAVDSLHPSMLGSYGNTSMSKFTENIDSLASEGVVFESAFAAAGSTPSRASFLTARHALRSGLVSGSRFGLSFFSPAQPGHLNPATTQTLPEMLKQDPSYGPMGHFGTWHLGYGGPDGAGLPLNHGYDRFFGTVMQPSLKSCDNGLGETTSVAQDKYGNALNEDTLEAQAAAAAAAAKSKQTIQSATEREYGITFWALWSMTSLLWQTLVLVTVIAWFANMIGTKYCW